MHSFQCHQILIKHVHAKYIMKCAPGMEKMAKSRANIFHVFCFSIAESYKPLHNLNSCAKYQCCDLTIVDFGIVMPQPLLPV